MSTDPAPSRRARRPRAQTVGGALAVLAVLTVSLNLRPGAASLGPLLGEITASLGQGETYGGLLTSLPGVCFGVLGVLAVPIAKRGGLTGTVLVGFAAAALGLLLRPLTSSATLFALLSVLVLSGPALGNVLVPAWVKRHGGERTVALMTMYSIALAIGGTAGSLLAVPLAPAGPDGWRASIMTWGFAALVPVVVWVFVLARTGHDFPPVAADAPVHGSILRSPTALALTAVFGLQSMNAYIQLGWLPRILADAGLAAATAGALTATVSACGIIGGLVMPTIIDRSRHLPRLMLAFGILTAAGWAGLLVAPASLALVWVLLLGLGGFVFPASIALIPARSRDPRVTARLSGMVQPIGYVLAAIGPFVVGALHEALGGWRVILGILVVLALLMGFLGLRASAPRMVDDELVL